MGRMESPPRTRWRPRGNGTGPLVVAHRGLVGPAPENTLESIAAAFSAGADAAEVDVRRGRDGRLILAHDPLQGARGALGPSSDPVGTPAPVELADALTLARGRLGLNLELKEAGLAADVAAAISRLSSPHEILVSSFLESEIETLAQVLPECPTGLVRGALGVSGRRLPGVVRQALACGATHLVIERHRARRRVLDGAVRTGLQVLVWTVNPPTQLGRLLHDPRVSGVITDRASLAVELRSTG
jgi:glycerophosphoryl diester phosphodiesterase